MSWFSRLGGFPFVRRTTPEETRSMSLDQQLSHIFGAFNGTGVSVTERSALTLSAAYACINVIATDLASLPLLCFRRLPGGGQVESPDVAGAYLLEHSADGNQTTSFKFRQDWIAHTLGWGNGFTKITRDSAGDPVRFDLLDPGVWEGRRRPDRTLFYVNKDSKATELYSDVMHLAGMGFDGVSGYSPIKLAKQAIGLGLAAETFGATFFGNKSTAGGWLKHPRKLTPEARINLRESVEAVHGGVKNAHRLGILEEGMEWVKTSVDPEDAQFLATRQFQVIEICRMYRVPPHKVGDLTQAHLANVEASNLDYIISTLRPWAVAIEAVANLRLLSEEERRAGYFFEHDLTALLRGDMKARAEYYQKMSMLGAINPDEIRESESRNPWPDGIGRIPLVPVNMMPLGRMVKEGPPKTGKASPPDSGETTDDAKDEGEPE